MKCGWMGEGGREWREGGREGEREGGREGGREGEREGGREGGFKTLRHHTFTYVIMSPSLPPSLAPSRTHTFLAPVPC